jgi:hypothetical protein
MNHIPKKRSVTEAEKIKAMIEDNDTNFHLMVEAYKQGARMQKARFDAYIEIGFTEEQAMRLCLRDG